MRYVASDLGFCCNKDNFSDSVPNAQRRYFSGHAWSLDLFWQSSTCLLVWLLVEGEEKKKTTGNSFLFRWTSGLRGFITNPQGPSPALPAVPLSSLILLLCLPSYIRTTASVVPSSTVTNWHAELSTGTLNPRDQAHRESSFISSPFGNCLCSSHGALGGFPHKGPMSLISNLQPGCKE